MSRRFDAIVIGAGQAGPSLAVRMAKEGLAVAIVERAAVGGTCVNYGCIPTKALVASARAAHVARRAADWGVVVEGEVRVDMKRVHDRMKAISGASNAGLTKWLEGAENVTLIRGHARLEGPKRIRVGEDVLTAERVFLNVGTRARIPELPGVADVPVLTNSTMLDLETLPEHLVVVGGSYIGLEFGQTFRRFGSRVTIVERGPRLVGREDEAVSSVIREVLEREGIEVRCGAECIRLERRGDGVGVGVSCASGPPEVEGSHVLLAVGRVPNTGDLGLDAAGIETDARGYVVVDDTLRTTTPGVWALGDCNGRGAFTHTSYNDYEIVAANLFDGEHRRVSDRVPCHALYVDPPLGRVGMTEREARASGRRVLVGRRPMSAVGRAKERGETDGFLSILVDADTERILGATILGIGGDEVVHTLIAQIYADASYTTLARSVPIHPNVAELLPTVLQNLEPLGD